VHSGNGVAVSAQAGGVLPLSQHSIFVLSSLAYHEYEGVALEAEEKPRLVRDLGDKHFLMLRNHGLLTVGTSWPRRRGDVFFETTCRIQVRAQAGGGNLRPILHKLSQAPRRNGAKSRGRRRRAGVAALLRKLDRLDPSYRT